jgi:hypothetical protein
MQKNLFESIRSHRRRAQRDEVETLDALLAAAREMQLLPSSISRELGSKVGME